MSVNKSLKTSIAVATSSSYGFFILNFLGQLVLARLLVPEHLGTYAVVLSLYSLLDSFVGFSVPMAYIQAKDTESLFGSALRLTLITSGISLVGSLCMYFIVKTVYDPSIALYLLLIGLPKPLNAIGNLILSDLEKQINFSKTYIIRGLSLAISMLGAVSLAYLGFEEKSLILREIISCCVLYLFAVLLNSRKINFYYEQKEIKLMLIFSVKMLMSRGAEIAYFKIPILMIAAIRDSHILGLFTQAFYLASLISTALNPITEKVGYVFYSKLARSSSADLKTYNHITFIILGVSIPCFCCLYVFSAEIVYFVYGDKWIEAAPIIKTLSPLVLILPLFNNLKSFLYSQDKSIFVTLAYIISMLTCTLLLALGYLGLAFTVSLMIGLIILKVGKLKHNATL